MVEPDDMKSPKEALLLLPSWTSNMKKREVVEINNHRFYVRRRWESLQFEPCTKDEPELRVHVDVGGVESHGPQLPAQIVLERGLCIYSGRSMVLSDSYTDAHALARNVLSRRVRIRGCIRYLAEWLTTPLSDLEARRSGFFRLFIQQRKLKQLQLDVAVSGKHVHAAFVSMSTLLLALPGVPLYGDVQFGKDLTDSGEDVKPKQIADEYALGIREEPDAINVEIGTPKSTVSLMVCVRVYPTDFRDSIRCLLLAKVKLSNVYLSKNNRFTIANTTVPVDGETEAVDGRKSVSFKRRLEQTKLIKEKVSKHVQGKTLLQVLCDSVLAAWISNPAFAVPEQVRDVDSAWLDELVAKLVKATKDDEDEAGARREDDPDEEGIHDVEPDDGGPHVEYAGYDGLDVINNGD